MHRRSPLTVLLLCDDDPRDHAPTTLEHIDAFTRYSRHRVFRFNPRHVRAARLLRLSVYDVIVIHHSLVPTMEEYVPRWLREQIARHRGLTVCFRQDEFRWVDATNVVLRQLGVDVLFSVSGRQAAERLYAPNLDRLQIVQVLTGYVPNGAGARPRVPLSSRPIDVGYRGRTLPYWLGKFAQEKAEIGKRFLARADRTDLVCDIAWDEEARIYGEDWTRFLESCRSMLGTEGGASIADFDGSVERAVTAYLERRHRATFEEVHDAVLQPYEGNLVVTAISPRIFEAAAAWTPMVLYPGEYSGVIEPERHYIPLEKDFSNFDDVVAALRDDRRLEAMATRAHEDLVASGRYSHRELISTFDAVVEERTAGRPRGRVAPTVVDAEHAQALREQRFRRWTKTPIRKVRETLIGVGAEGLRAAVAAYLVLEHPWFRSLWRNYVDQPSLLLLARPGGLVRDLMRLNLATRLRGSGALGASFDDAEAEVRLSAASSGSAPAPPVGLRAIVWDFAGGQDEVRCEIPVGIRMVVPCRRPGEERYRFVALERHSRVAPERVWRALAPLFDDDRRAH